MTPVPPRNAATLLVARDAAPGPELYMVRRHPRSHFMAGALVFVGGAVDPTDSEGSILARCTGLTGEEAAQRLGLEQPARALGYYVASLRECFEEAGLLLAQGNLPAPEHLADMRARLNRGQATLAGLLEQHALSLPLDRLRYLDRWITPEPRDTRFDARFFVCKAPDDQQATHDPGETSDGAWFAIDDVLAGNRAGELSLAPPTLVILERLQACRSVEALLAAAPDAPVRPTMPRVLWDATPLTLLLPTDHRYDDPASPGGVVDMVQLVDGTWRHVVG